MIKVITDNSDEYIEAGKDNTRYWLIKRIKKFSPTIIVLNSKEKKKVVDFWEGKDDKKIKTLVVV